MPAQVADWPQVKATAIATGSLLEAADYHGIKYEAVRQRASREQWPVGRRVHEQLKQAQDVANQQIMRASGGTVTSVTSASEAIAQVVADRQGEIRLQQSKYLVRASTALADVTDEELLAHAPTGKTLADMASKVYPEEQRDTSLSFNFFTVQPEQPVERTVIDVEQA